VGYCNKEDERLACIIQPFDRALLFLVVTFAFVDHILLLPNGCLGLKQ
jgi:hypothetical protein